MQQTPEAAAFEAFVAAHQECETVADCTLIMPGCPLGCYVAVDAASAAEAEQVALAARAEGPACVYRCALPPALACEDSRCVARAAATGWEQLPDPPVSGRVDALVVAVGDSVVVTGGWDWLCPPGADCGLPPETQIFADGAAYGVSAGEWKQIADAPVGLRAVASAVVGDDVYALSQCDSGPACPAGRGLLRYRSATDEWDRLPAPEATGSYGLVGVPRPHHQESGSLGESGRLRRILGVP
jgi:hypothetical protein